MGFGDRIREEYTGDKETDLGCCRRTEAKTGKQEEASTFMLRHGRGSFFGLVCLVVLDVLSCGS